MYDVKKRLKYLKKMYKRVIPDEYANDGDAKKYKTEYERYNAIYKELKSCDVRERDNIEVLLRCEYGTADRLRAFKGIVTVFISIISIMISVGASFIGKMIDISTGTIKNALLVQALSQVLVTIGFAALLAILLYTGLDMWCSRGMDKTTYLLEVLKKVNEELSKQ